MRVGFINGLPFEILLKSTWEYELATGLVDERGCFITPDKADVDPLVYEYLDPPKQVGGVVFRTPRKEPQRRQWASSVRLDPRPCHANEDVSEARTHMLGESESERSKVGAEVLGRAGQCHRSHNMVVIHRVSGVRLQEELFEGWYVFQDGNQIFH
jgi:hypothetical protein